MHNAASVPKGARMQIILNGTRPSAETVPPIA
jgi:hypothetical protein